MLAAATPFVPPSKLEKPKVAPSKLTLDLPAIPSAAGLSVPPPENKSELRSAPHEDREPAPGGPSAKVEKATHARDFVESAAGLRSRGAILGFHVPALPAKLDPFKTCLRLSSRDGSPAVIKAKFISPSGEELRALRGDVLFSRDRLVDFVLDWGSIEIHQTGEHRIAVTLDGSPASELVLPVKKK
jgi:hypothetical protein